MENANQIPFSFQPVPEDRRCTARSKRSGEQCKNWACHGKACCRFHGGKSTGAKTAEGRERSRMARLVHGNDSLEVLKIREAERVLKTADVLAADALCFLDYARRRIARMEYAEYRQARPLFSQFCKGEISIYRLIEVLDGKEIKPGRTGLTDLCAGSYPMLPEIIKREIEKRRR